MAAGALSSLTNGSSLVSTLFYNPRLQPCRISVKNTGVAPGSCADSTTGNVLDYTYNFSLGVADNGNVTAITNNLNTGRSQSFTYDPLNRIQLAATQATTGQYAWGLSFGYDVWANLLSATVTQGSAIPLSVSATNKNQVSGNSYDAAGDMTYDGSYNYSYDAENRLSTAAGVTYTYDGDGKRVQKSNGKLYWYGTGSDPLDETDLAGNLTEEYVFFNGKRIARRDSSNNVNYYFADHLGTARVVTNASGTTLDDSDFYPFGGERPYLSSSGNTYKFTGKERDAESGLDDFGARYYSSALGRFVSSDWSAVPAAVPYANLANPQTLNLYAIVHDNPETFADLDGHEGLYDSSDLAREAVEAIARLRKEYEEKIKRDKEKAAAIAAIKEQKSQQEKPSEASAGVMALPVIARTILGAEEGAEGGAVLGTAEPGGGNVVGGLGGAIIDAAIAGFAPTVYSKTKDALKETAQRLDTAITHLNSPNKLGGPDQDPRRGWRNTVRRSADQLDKLADTIANKNTANAARLTAQLLRGLVD